MPAGRVSTEQDAPDLASIASVSGTAGWAGAATAGQTLLIHGAGSTVGYATVQIALIRGARVVATAGQTYARRLRDLGATVTAYGDGLVERVNVISDGLVDLVLDAAPVGGPIAGTFPLQDWRAAMEISLSGHARGKLLLLP